MYKFFFTLLAVLVAGIFLYLTFVGSLVNPVTLYTSLDLNISFNTLVTYSPKPSPQGDSIIITRAVIDNQPQLLGDVVVKRFDQGVTSLSLPARIGQYFRSPIFNVAVASSSSSGGLLFSWNGNTGVEKGFGFDCSNYLCLVLTDGYGSTDKTVAKDIGKEFDTVADSIKLVSF